MQQWSISSLCQGSSPCRSDASASLHGGRVLLLGGRTEAGAATNDMRVLDLQGLAQGRGWQVLGTAGQPPSPRWGHSTFVFEKKLWVYGGCDGQQAFEDLWTLDLQQFQWQKVQQGGVVPNRQLRKYSRSFQAAAVSPTGHSMLAFGMQDTAWNQSDVIRADNLLALEAGCSALLACVQDTDPENADPSRRAGSPALRLHAFDLDQHRWSAVHAAGSISFQKLEALECHGSKLIAVGWSGGKSESDMQVCCLDLSSIHSCRTPSFAASSTRSRPTPSWQVLRTHGMLPSARTGAATAVLGNQLLLSGGMLCNKSVSGRLTGDTYMLDLSTLSWTRMSPAQERAVGNMPRASHSVVAVPSAAAFMLIGGTSSRQACASCDTVTCLRQVGGAPAISARPSEVTTAVAAGGAGQGMAEVLSTTPTLLGIQPFGNVTSTPRFVLAPTTGTPNTATAAPAATPAVQQASPPGASADAAALAAAPPSALFPSLDFSRFCFSDELSDIELVAGGSSFSAHRLLLCAQSPRLAELIQAQTGKAFSTLVPGGECRWTLNLPDIYPDILALMLQYMYNSLTSVPVESASLLFKAADRYGLPGLRSACLKVVIATIDLDNVCHNVLLAHDNKCSELSQACILFVAASPERFQQVLVTPGYLDLNQAHPRVGTAFVQSVTQLLMAKRA